MLSFGALCVGLLGCGQQPSRPHGIVLVTFDTLNVLWTGPYNAQVDYTPHLDALAAEGLVFDNAYTRVPITLPSHATLLSGRPPTDIGVMLNGDRVPEDVVTLAEELQGVGYQTAAFLSLGVLKDGFNLDQGFETYDAEFGAETRRWYRTADEVYAAAGVWLDANADEPFFIWVHLSDPHEPYVPNDAPPDARLELDGVTHGEWNLRSKEQHDVVLNLAPGRHILRLSSLRTPAVDESEKTSLIGKFTRRETLESVLVSTTQPLDAELWLKEPVEFELEVPEGAELSVEFTLTGRINSPPVSEVLENYEYEVRYADRYFGELRSKVASRTEDVLWMVSSDHGEGLFHHGTIGHAASAHEDQMRVLWLMSGPGVPAAARVSAPVLNEDIMPTALEYLDMPIPQRVLGRSRLGCLEQLDCAGRPEWWAYGASMGQMKITAVAAYRWPFKFLWHNRGRSGAFHLVDDPSEEYNLAGGRGRSADSRLQEFSDLTDRFEEKRMEYDELLATRSGAVENELDEEMLRSLGYLNN